MKKYKYLGKLPVHLAMIGNVTEGQVITAPFINHPDFEEVKDAKEEAKDVKVVNK